MCRSDISLDARGALGTLLAHMAETLAASAGVTSDKVVIGPVDFGSEEDGAE